MKKNKPNILIVSSGIKGPTLMGGIATAFYNLAILLAKQNFNVNVLYAAHPFYGSKEKDPEYWAEEFKKQNINFIPLTDKTDCYGQQMMVRSYRIYNYLNTSKTKYDKIVFHDFGGIGYYTVLAKRNLNKFANTELIISCHGNNRLSDNFNGRNIDSHNKLMDYYLEQKSVEYADKTVTPSKFYETWFKDHHYLQPNNHVIQNVVHDKSIIYTDSIHSKINKQKIKHFCFFGRIETLKGIFLVVNAIQHLKETSPEILNSIRLTFIGNAVQINGRNSILLLKKEFDKIDFKVNFKTNLNTEEALKFMRKTNGIMLNPTLGETSSYTVMESILNGIPFLASDIAPIKELIPKKFHSSNLFGNNNSESLAEKMIDYVQKEIPSPDLKTPKDKTESKWVELLSNPYKKDKTSKVQLTESKISVIIPTKDRIDLLESTLHSVLNQGYSNYDIYVGNDNGRKDNEDLEKMILNIHNPKSIPISLYKFKNNGKAHICNELSKKADCEFLMLFDDDDIALPNMLSTYNASAKLTKGKFFTDITQCFEEDDEGESVDWNPKKITYKHISLGVGDSASVNFFINYFGKPNFFVEKTTYQHIGGMTEKYPNTPYIDWDLFAKASAKDVEITMIPEVLYLYRMKSRNSIYYGAHDVNSNEAIQRRLLGHKKVAENFASAVPVKWRDVFMYSHLQLALPKIDDSASKNLNNQIETLRKKNKETEKELSWYKKELEHVIKYHHLEIDKSNSWHQNEINIVPKWNRHIWVAVRKLIKK